MLFGYKFVLYMHPAVANKSSAALNALKAYRLIEWSFFTHRIAPKACIQLQTVKFMNNDTSYHVVVQQWDMEPELLIAGPRSQSQECSESQQC